MSSAQPSDLSIVPEWRGPVLVARLSGRFGHGSYGQAFTSLRAWLREGIRGVVLEMSALEYLSSAGVAAIMRLKSDLEARGVGLRMACPPAFVGRLLDAAGVSEAIPVDASLDAAVAALAPPPSPSPSS